MRNPESGVETQTKIPNPIDYVRRVTSRGLLGLCLSVGTGATLATIESTASSAPAEAATLNCGDVTLGGSDWLQGHGVDVHYNGVDQASTDSCQDGGNEYYDRTNNPPTRFGLGWQCVELVNRLYHALGWYDQMTLGPETNYDAKYMYDYARDGKYPGLEAHANGSGYVPVPGDLIVDSNNGAGHIFANDHIDSANKKLVGVEQNGSSTGWVEYSFDPKTATVSDPSFTVLGFIHAQKNTMTDNGVVPFSSVNEGQEATDGYFVYTNVGGSLWPIKKEGEWTDSDTKYWGNKPIKITTDEVHAHEAGYDANGSNPTAHPPHDKTALLVDGAGSTVYYFMGGNAYTVGSSKEMQDLGITNVGRIPQTFNRLNAFLGRTLTLANGSIYRFGLNKEVRQVYTQADSSRTSFVIPNTSILECIQLAQNHPLIALPQSARQYLNVNTISSEANGCLYPKNWALSKPGDKSQYRVDGNGRSDAPYVKRPYPNMFTLLMNTNGNPVYHNINSVAGMSVGSNMAPPDGVFFRSTANSSVYEWLSAQARPVPSMDILNCLGPSSIVQIPKESFPSNLPMGSNMACSFEGKLLHDTSGNSIWQIVNNQKRSVLNTAIMEGIRIRDNATQHRIVDVSHARIGSFATGRNAYVNYGPPVFLRYKDDSTVWLVQSDGTRRHALSVCNGAQIQTPPNGEMAGHTVGAD